jgi:hypothetical protein
MQTVVQSGQQSSHGFTQMHTIFPSGLSDAISQGSAHSYHIFLISVGGHANGKCHQVSTPHSWTKPTYLEMK